MIRTVYHFDDLSRKVPVGSYDDGYNSVGGRIFFINSNSDETVEFYDANGNVLSNVAVGDTPSYYKVTSDGVSGKDKFYVYYDSIEITNKSWTYDSVFVNLGTSDGIGVGKNNTSIVLASDNGAYGTHDTTIWYYLLSARTQRVGNCDDWYIGSKSELEELRLFLNNNPSFTQFFNSYYLWSSSEFNGSWGSELAWYWQNSKWDSYNNKNGQRSSILIRSF